MRGLDYSAGRIDGQTIKAAGYDFVIRYVDDPTVGLNSKHITPDEYDNLIQAGVTVYLVFEIDTTDALGGFSAGVQNAHRARAGADWIGYPPGGLIFFCSDRHLTAAEIPQALAYLDGAVSVLGHTSVGCYGFWEYVDAAIQANKAVAYWQCGIAPDATDPVQVWQENTGTAVIGGIECDIDDLLRPIGAAPAPTPPPPPAPGGIESMAFTDTFKDWAGNEQTVQSWMDHTDERLTRIDNFLFAPGIEPSRIPGDANKTNGRDAIMDTVARASIAKAEVEALSAKVEAVASAVEALAAQVAKEAPATPGAPVPALDLDALAAKVAAHLAASVQFTAK